MIYTTANKLDWLTAALRNPKLVDPVEIGRVVDHIEALKRKAIGRGVSAGGYETLIFADGSQF